MATGVVTLTRSGRTIGSGAAIQKAADGFWVRPAKGARRRSAQPVACGRVRPTIERVRRKIGSGSPNTVSPMLERWFATLGKRLEGRGGASLVDGEAKKLPLAMIQAAQQIWDVARREADQVQVQKTEATRRELELQCDALAQKEAELRQRETFFEQARVALDEALASSRQAVAAMETQMHAQQQESARLLADSEAEVRRMRKALDEAVARKEVLREKGHGAGLQAARSGRSRGAASRTGTPPPLRG